MSKSLKSWRTGVVAAVPLLILWTCKRGSEPQAPQGHAGAGTERPTLKAGNQATHVGGSAGAGGGGPSGGDGAVAPDPGWILDDSRWQRIAGAAFLEPACTAYEVRRGMLQVPPLRWEACGDGCASADVLHGYANTGSTGALSNRRAQDRWSPSIGYQFAIEGTNAGITVAMFVLLDTAETVTALRLVPAGRTEYSACSFGTLGGGVAISGGSQGIPDRPNFMLAGSLAEDQAAWTWAEPEVTLPFGPFGSTSVRLDLANGEGETFLVGGGAVQKQRTLDGSAMEILENPSGAQFGAAHGDLALWTDYAVDHTRVRGWATDGLGVRTIIENAPPGTCQVDVSSTRIVGYQASGTQIETGRCGGQPADEIRLWTSPRASEASGVVITEGPLVATTPFQVANFTTWGDFAAITTVPYVRDGTSYTRGSDLKLLVTRLPSGPTYRLDATAGRELPGWAVLSDTHLYFPEAEPPTNGRVVQRIVRIELSKIGTHGEVL